MAYRKDWQTLILFEGFIITWWENGDRDKEKSFFVHDVF